MERITIDFDPIIFSITDSIQIRWYGLMYVIGFICGSYFLNKLIKRNFFQLDKTKIDSLIFTIIICMFIGARTLYVFVYNWDYYQNHLGEIVAIWKGGLSFHGALFGILAAGYIFAKKHKISWAQAMDTIALAGCPGLFLGRIGNFINGELYGRITQSPVGMIFPQGGPMPRHPSQLYEGFGEGILLMIILWAIMRRVNFYGYISCAFLIGYGTIRFIVEFFREADHQLGYYFGNSITMGQILCFLMIMLGVAGIPFVKKWNLPIPRPSADQGTT